MRDLVTPVGTSASDLLCDATAADDFWQWLPRSDPLAAQKALSEALGSLVARGNPSVDQLQAVLALDQQAQVLVDALLINFVPGDAESPTLERAYWQSAFELCRAFGHAYGYCLRSVRDRDCYRRWREYLPSMLVRLFQHRQCELLLRPYVDDLSTRFSWLGVHEAYQYAHSHGMLQRPLPVSRCRAKVKEESTLEREYVHVLLQGLMSGGHFSPHDAFLVSQGMPRWCGALTLQPHQVSVAEDRFVVDLNSDAGLSRSSLEPASTRLCIDTSPALASIRNELADLRDSNNAPHIRSAPGRGRQLKVLRKVSSLITPKPPRVARRGERKPVTLAVEILIGLTQVIGALRNKPRPARTTESPATPVKPAAPPALETHQSTLTMFGGFTAVRTTGLAGSENTVSGMSTGDFDAGYPLWKVVDRSDSGCRLQGQVFDSNWVIPGTLIAFREDATTPWTLAVVRRVEKQADSRADIGVEYVGRNPRGVKITLDEASDESHAGSPEGDQPSFAALYLAESTEHPVMPIKTLILPVQNVPPDGRLKLRSKAAIYSIRLGDPLEEQGDFIWSPFNIVERSSRAEPESDKAASAP